MPTNYASYSLHILPPNPPILLPTEIPPCDVHFSDSVPVLVVYLVFVFIVYLSFIILALFVDNCEFIVILLFIFLISLF